MRIVLFYDRSCYTVKCKTRSQEGWTVFLYEDSFPVTVVSYIAWSNDQEW